MPAPPAEHPLPPSVAHARHARRMDAGSDELLSATLALSTYGVNRVLAPLRLLVMWTQPLNACCSQQARIGSDKYLVGQLGMLSFDFGAGQQHPAPANLSNSEQPTA